MAHGPASSSTSTSAAASGSAAPAPSPPQLADAINELCPWSGKPIAADSLTRYRGEVVGFCNPGCRDKFETAVTTFEAALASRPR